MRNSLLVCLFTTAFMASPLQFSTAWALEDEHDHTSAKEYSDHNESVHDSHEDENEHDDHGHEEDVESKEDDHVEDDGHDHDEEGKVDATEIEPDHARKAGVTSNVAKAGSIVKEVVLNGQITLNRDTTANVRARFPGIVRDVSVKLGQTVKKGDVLARLESNESLRDYTITAPVSGVILERNTNIGDVASDETLFVIADLSNVWAKFHIFPKDTDLIREGQSVRVHTVDHTKEIQGTIKLFLPTAEALSQTHVVIVELDNVESDWRPGLTIDGHVEVARKHASVIVPKTALQSMENRKVLFVTDGSEYEARPVELGDDNDHEVEIIHGLVAGEKYVSEGSFIIKADIMKSGAAHEH